MGDLEQMQITTFIVSLSFEESLGRRRKNQGNSSCSDCRQGQVAFSVSEDSAPPGRGFSRHEGLSSDAHFCMGMPSARGETSRAVWHRLDEPYQVIPQHGCIPAEPASVSPGKVIVAALERCASCFHARSGRGPPGKSPFDDCQGGSKLLETEK